MWFTVCAPKKFEKHMTATSNTREVDSNRKILGQLDHTPENPPITDHACHSESFGRMGAESLACPRERSRCVERRVIIIIMIIREIVIGRKSVPASGEVAVVYFTVEARSATAAPSGNCHQFVAEDSNEL